MPLLRINWFAGKDSQLQRELKDAAHKAMTETIGVPPADKFQISTAEDPGQLVFPPEYLDIPHRGRSFLFR